MKRDFELLKKILIEIENFPDVKRRSIQINGYSPQELNYHIGLLHEANLLKGKSHSDDSWFVSSLTWEGHEFLDAIKNDTVWKKAKQIISEKGGNISVEVLKTLLQQLLLKTFIP